MIEEIGSDFYAVKSEASSLNQILNTPTTVAYRLDFNNLKKDLACSEVLKFLEEGGSLLK